MGSLEKPEGGVDYPRNFNEFETFFENEITHAENMLQKSVGQMALYVHNVIQMKSLGKQGEDIFIVKVAAVWCQSQQALYSRKLSVH